MLLEPVLGLISEISKNGFLQAVLFDFKAIDKSLEKVYNNRECIVVARSTLYVDNS